MRDHRSVDRRVRRTRERLHEALASLIHQKPYDDIAVKEILARADVGRSTFYTHFRDKDELLVSGIRDLLRGGESASLALDGRTERLLRFSLPLLEHLERVAASVAGSPAARRPAVMHERLRELLTERLEASLCTRPTRPREPEVPATLVARHVAATFVLVLESWAEDGMRVPAREADAWFRALVRPALVAMLEPPAAGA